MDTSSTSSFSDDDVDDDDHGDEESHRRRQVILACEEHARQRLGAADRAEERVLGGRSLSWRTQADALWSRLCADLYDEQEPVYESSNENDVFSKLAKNELQMTQPIAEEQFGQFRLWSDGPRQVPAGALRERVEERLRRARCAHVLRHMDGPVGYDTPQAWGLSASRSDCIPGADIEVDAQGFVVYSFADTLPVRYRDTRRGPKLRFSTRGHEAPHQKN